MPADNCFVVAARGKQCEPAVRIEGGRFFDPLIDHGLAVNFEDASVSHHLEMNGRSQ
jgi:hypothetical protein